MKKIASLSCLVVALGLSACGDSQKSSSDTGRTVVDFEANSGKADDDDKDKKAPIFDDYINVVDGKKPGKKDPGQNDPGQNNPGQNDDPSQNDDPGQNDNLRRAVVLCGGAIANKRARLETLATVRSAAFLVRSADQVEKVLDSTIRNLRAECLREFSASNQCNGIRLANFDNFGRKVVLQDGKSFFECRLAR